MPIIFEWMSTLIVARSAKKANISQSICIVARSCFISWATLLKRPPSQHQTNTRKIQIQIVIIKYSYKYSKYKISLTVSKIITSTKKVFSTYKSSKYTLPSIAYLLLTPLNNNQPTISSTIILIVYKLKLRPRI